MAAMGGGKVSGKFGKIKLGKVQKPAELQPLAPPFVRGVNVVISIGELAPVMERGIDLPVVGLPIMREGFVTETGFLPRSIDA